MPDLSKQKSKKGPNQFFISITWQIKSQFITGREWRSRTFTSWFLVASEQKVYTCASIPMRCSVLPSPSGNCFFMANYCHSVCAERRPNGHLRFYWRLLRFSAALLSGLLINAPSLCVDLGLPGDSCRCVGLWIRPGLGPEIGPNVASRISRNPRVGTFEPDGYGLYDMVEKLRPGRWWAWEGGSPPVGFWTLRLEGIQAPAYQSFFLNPPPFARCRVSVCNFVTFRPCISTYLTPNSKSIILCFLCRNDSFFP